MGEKDIGAVREVDRFLACKWHIEVSLFSLFLDGSFKSFVVLFFWVDDDGGIGFWVSKDALKGDVGVVDGQFFFLGHNLLL